MEPDRDGVSPAPIHTDRAVVKVVPEKNWPKHRPLPLVQSKSLRVRWQGRSSTAKGHALPALMLKVELVVTAGTQLYSAHDKSKKLPPTHLPNDDRDVFSFELPLHSIDSNKVTLAAEFADETATKFEIQYSLDLKESVFGTHESCEKEGVKLDEKTAGGLSAYLFMRCVREDRMLYLNIGKPIDRELLAEGGLRQLKNASGGLVIEIPMHDEERPREANLGQIRLVDPKGRGERYEVLYASSGPRHWRLHLGYSPTFTFTSENSGVLRTTQFPQILRLGLGYRILPGRVEFNFDGYGTVLPILMSGPVPEVPAAEFHGFGAHVGYLFPMESRAHSLGVYGGWFDWIMRVPGNGYGLPRRGYTNLSGPQFILAARYRPHGSLGWSAYLKYVMLAERSELFGFNRILKGEWALGFAHEIFWFKNAIRRPSVSADFSRTTLDIRNVDIHVLQFSVGLQYPIL